jgi:hypothetical protein
MVPASTKGMLVGLQLRIWLSDPEPHSRLEGAGPAIIRIILAFACCIAVAACATEQKVVWARTDGRPVVQTLLEIDQADCRDEVQKENPSGNNNKIGLLRGQSKVDDKFAGCMAERGYLAAK